MLLLYLGTLCCQSGPRRCWAEPDQREGRASTCRKLITALEWWSSTFTRPPQRFMLCTPDRLIKRTKLPDDANDDARSDFFFYTNRPGDVSSILNRVWIEVYVVTVSTGSTAAAYFFYYYHLFIYFYRWKAPEINEETRPSPYWSPVASLTSPHCRCPLAASINRSVQRMREQLATNQAEERIVNHRWSNRVDPRMGIIS